MTQQAVVVAILVHMVKTVMLATIQPVQTSLQVRVETVLAEALPAQVVEPWVL